MTEPTNEPPSEDQWRDASSGGDVPKYPPTRHVARPHVRGDASPGEGATSPAEAPLPADAMRPAQSTSPSRAPDPVFRSPVVKVARGVAVDLEQSFAGSRQPPSRIRGWLYQREEVAHDARKPWYQVLCLTGVDYFSTLGYQPGIAILAAGLLSPVATLVLVLFTLFAALPVYRRVAEASPHGQGSIAMLEKLLPRWRGKLFVLCLLGFAATSWIVTITLSSADATAHIVENPYVPATLQHNTTVDVVVTLLLIGSLGAVFLRGFKEAIGIAVVLVLVYLALNLVIVARSFGEIGSDPGLFSDWLDALRAERGTPLEWIGAAVLIFPRLALGLSGFETGVAVMPLVKGDATDTEGSPAGRIRNTKKLLSAAALIMSFYLIASSVATTVLIPPAAFEEGGEAAGRALAFLAHEQFGDLFGTAYDLSTIAILWFAGASAMAGLLNLVPRYLPAYGMAPKWAAAQRPLVLIFTAISFVVTVVFLADVEAQGSAYATGVLSLMASASIAVAIALRQARSRWLWVFGPIAVAFLFITFQNIREQPSGLAIAACFVVAIVATSVISRILRSTELRFNRVTIDRPANQLIAAAIQDGAVRFITHDPVRGTTPEAYAAEVATARRRHGLRQDDSFLLVEVQTGDPSAFVADLGVSGHAVGEYGLLRCNGAAVANAISAFALAIHAQYGCTVHLYMRWTPIDSLLDAIGEGIEFLMWGGGDMARLVELEVRREAREGDIIVHAA